MSNIDQDIQDLDATLDGLTLQEAALFKDQEAAKESLDRSKARAEEEERGYSACPPSPALVPSTNY